MSPNNAIHTLGMMGQPGMAAYLSLLTNEDARVRSLAIGQSQTFSRSFYQFPEVTAQIEKSKRDQDFQVRVVATNALLPNVPPVVTNLNKF